MSCELHDALYVTLHDMSRGPCQNPERFRELMGSQDCANLVLMREIRNNSWWTHISVFVWLSVWMVLIPLFHVHPEGDHLYGTAGHVHGGIVHSVFSPDLDGEYDNHHHTTDGFGHSSPEHDGLLAHPAHGTEFAEITFPFLIDSPDRKLPKPIGSKLLVVDFAEYIAPALVSLFVQCNESPPHQRFALQHISTRAPPSVFV